MDTSQPTAEQSIERDVSRLSADNFTDEMRLKELSKIVLQTMRGAVRWLTNPCPGKTLPFFCLLRRWTLCVPMTSY